ncbi:efflux RND transporter periplasmic adaptor subunit [Acidithiobacillus acidisediminis]|uniref:efflux RND transporter periplasmic adaptor subunit n=1 Tax=Acidithiobacillus TaxID=119977 RepID=UPI00200F6607|nr:efflux RND transporter periplasmic adaptor subunit [Acidithiobacillus sp. S30A2]
MISFIRSVQFALLAMGLLLATVAWGGVSALVQVTPARNMHFVQQLRAYGNVEFAPEGGRSVSVQAESQVQHVWVAAGQRVRRGERLLQVQPSVADRLQYRQAQIDVHFAQSDLDRLQTLRQRQLATNAQVQAAQQSVSKAQAVLQDWRSRLASMGTGVLRAPIDGVVTQVPVEEGAVIAAGQPLLRLSTGNALRVVLGIEPADLARVQSGDSVKLRPVYGSGLQWTGKISQIYEQVDPQSRLAHVVVALPASPGLLPGMMLQAEIQLGQEDALAIPDRAVLYAGKRAYCYVNVQGRAQRRWIQMGSREGDWIAVRQGLHAGESVVSLGNYELRNGMALRLQRGS